LNVSDVRKKELEAHHVSQCLLSLLSFLYIPLVSMEWLLASN